MEGDISYYCEDLLLKHRSLCAHRRIQDDVDVRDTLDVDDGDGHAHDDNGDDDDDGDGGR